MVKNVEYDIKTQYQQMSLDRLGFLYLPGKVVIQDNCYWMLSEGELRSFELFALIPKRYEHLHQAVRTQNGLADLHAGRILVL